MQTSTITTSRQASVQEIVNEMDRRGQVIVDLERQVEDLRNTVEILNEALMPLSDECSSYREALESIDAVGVDFGHFEDAARTMHEHARTALYSQPAKRCQPEDRA